MNWERCARSLPFYYAYNPNSHESEANKLWTRTIDRDIMAGLLEGEVSTVSGPPPEITEDITQTKETQSLRIEIKISDLAGNRTWVAVGKTGTLSTTPRRRTNS